MADAIPLAMMEFLGVVWMQTGTLWERTLEANGHFPGQPLQGVPRFGPWFGLLLGEALSRRDRHRGMGLQHL
jgi:hypothetical protein